MSNSENKNNGNNAQIEDKISEGNNLLGGTTYALNKSNSKSVTVGLRCDGFNIFTPYVYISGTSSSKPVRLTRENWISFTENIEVLDAYFFNHNDFVSKYSNPSKMYLDGFDVAFSTTYSKKSIVFEERPSGQNSKKFKFSDPPLSALQEPTFAGLKRVRSCIDAKLYYVLRLAEVAENMSSQILKYFENLISENVRERANICSIATFKNLYERHTPALLSLLLTSEALEMSGGMPLELLFNELSLFAITEFWKRLVLFAEHMFGKDYAFDSETEAILLEVSTQSM